MALPIVGFLFLIALILVLFIIGVSRYNVNASLAFIVFASVLMMSTAMLVMGGGVQLDTVESIDPDTLTYSYQVVTYDVNTWNWLRLITETLFWGSFVGIIFGFAFNFQRTKSRRIDEWSV